MGKSTNVLFCPQPKAIQFTREVCSLKYEWREKPEKKITFKKLESETWLWDGS